MPRRGQSAAQLRVVMAFRLANRYASLRPGSYSCPFETIIARFEPNSSTMTGKLFDSAIV
jgi:hypothetical protein